MNDVTGRPNAAARLRDRCYRAWIELTGQEQQAVLLVLALFLLGLTVRCWRGL
jgi:hypothetical protein